MAYTFLFTSHILRVHEWEQNYAGSRGSSSLHRMDDRRTSSNATLLMNLCHIGKLTVDSFYMLLGVYYSSLPATSVVSWLCYTLNKLDTSSNGIYTVRNPRAGYVTTVLGFLNWVDPLDLVSNYYLYNRGELYKSYIIGVSYIKAIAQQHKQVYLLP